MAETRILIVDDNADNVALLEAILQTQNYATIAARGGQAALAQVAEAPPTLILLDVMLPDLDGYTVARQIKADPHLPFIPIILVTAKHELRDKVYGLEQGADDFLSKPVNRTELLARVHALLRLKQMHDTLHQQHGELVALNERLQTSEHLHQELVQMITHDLRSPLTALQAILELAGDGSLGPLSDRQRLFMQIGLQNCKTLGRMVSDMLDVFRMEAGHLEMERKPVDLYRLGSSVCEQMQAAILERGLELVNGIPAGLPPVEADPDRLGRVLLNLISNAVKYTERGAITLGAAVGGPVPPGTALPAAYMLVGVADTGPGIPPEARPYVFDKFYRVQHGTGSGGRPPGTGLGLTFCKQTIEAHGGQIWVESGPDEVGSRFAFTLPLAPPA